MLLPAYRALHSGSGKYERYAPGENVYTNIAVPRCRLQCFGDGALSIAAPRLWNDLPGSITECKPIGALNKDLKIPLSGRHL